jgi:hypothetical protein
MHCRRFFSKLGYFARFSINIINIAGRISETAMGGAGARSAPFCLLMSLKRRVRAVHGCARAAKKIHLLKRNPDFVAFIPSTVHRQAAAGGGGRVGYPSKPVV